MIISVNWLKQFTQIDASIDELATTIGARLVEIEGVEAIGKKYDGAVIARIVECHKLENSDHLNVTRIDDGGAALGVERGEDGYVQVVCGATNVREGMRVVWLPPGSTVPETFGESEPFVLGARNLRGVMSNGMLASARELDLYDDHTGIVDVDKDVAPGTPLLDAFALDDYLLDIENKSLTHRPDTFGIVGFAREVAAIAGKGFTTPEWLLNKNPELGTVEASRELNVTIDDAHLSARYQAVVLSGASEAARTPLEVQTYLARSGVRPISPIVDVTNYLMLLSGQPLHAFDYDKVVSLSGSADIHVRAGRPDEKLELLDGRTITLEPEDIVIASGETAIGLAGAMGGAATEIDASTTTIILESATFNLYNLRATQMRHGIFSEAITRFTKGQPAALTAPVLAEAIRLVGEWTGARRVSDVAESYPEPQAEPTLTLHLQKINEVLGTKFTQSDVVETLGNVEFLAEADGENITVTPPYWRTDIHSDEDIIEEVGRLNGFDSIETTLPTRDFTAVSPDAFDRLRMQIRETLAAAGANEILTYSFVHGETLKRATQNPDAAYQLANALSPDLQYYRLSLTPSLLSVVNMNLRQKFDEFALFELNKSHQKDMTSEQEPSLPYEFSRLALVYAAGDKQASERGSAYYQAKYYLEFLFGRLHIPRVSFVPMTDSDGDDTMSAPYEPKRSALVMIGDAYIGVVGEYKKSVARSFKLPVFTAGFELNLDLLSTHYSRVAPYVPLNRFPGSEGDITFQGSADVTYERIVAAASEVLGSEPLQSSITPLDLYQPQNSHDRNVTIRIRLESYDKTLTGSEVNDVIDRVAHSVAEKLSLRII